MLQSLLALATTKPLDVQIWHCDPLMVVMNEKDVVYLRKVTLEFTPFEGKDLIGHCQALEPNDKGLKPEIAVQSRQYIDDMPGWLGVHGRRQGIILTGNDESGTPQIWLINGAADEFVIDPSNNQVEYDEETAKALEEELDGRAEKLNLDTF